MEKIPKYPSFIKKALWISASICTTSIIIFYCYYFFWSAKSEKFTYFNNTCDNDSRVVIGIIGDSWINKQKYVDSMFIHQWEQHGIENWEILVASQPGAKSKQVYQNLFYTQEHRFGSKFIIDNCPKACIVIVGVNDVSGQIGADYYSHHLILIIKTLLHYRIKPIIVELPEFGIEEGLAKMQFIKQVRNKIFSQINNGGNINNIQHYRDYFKKELENTNLTDSIILVKFDKICCNYYQCFELYENPLHLNNKGSQKLVEAINELLIPYLLSKADK